MSQHKPNRLKDEKSVYLSSAAHQPVDWYPWGREALDRAKKEQKPILLDIGAVWCHWCHVMDRESYESEDIAALINQHFVPVKVDRDESPDIDARFQAAISAITRQGGWPLTAFLTPGGRPFFGGTYFPPDDRWGRPGFKSILATVAEKFQNARGDIEESAARLTEALQKSETFADAGREFDPGGAVNAILENARSLFDERNGGFGQSPKFPHPTVLDLLMETVQASDGDEGVMRVINATLTGMARGGVYDQLAGGFHRYSVDERWHVPHFEKMTYDNSELLRTYLHGYQLTGNAFYREVAGGIITWVDRDLSDTERGGFFASQDADINLEDDGDHFTWTMDELQQALAPEEVQLMVEHFNVREVGDMHHNPARNVLALASTPEEIAERRGQPVDEVTKAVEAARKKMLAVRHQRPIPFIDKTVYVSWNGLFISAYLEAARVLERDDCREQALRTLDRLLDSAWSLTWGFAHRCPEEGKISEEEWSGGVLEDQVYLIHALLDAYESTCDSGYFKRAEEAMGLCLKHFWDEKGGGFFDRPVGAPPIAEELEIPRKPFQDSPTPGANSVAAMALDRLHGYTLKDDYRQKAQRTLEAFAGAVPVYGFFAASYGLAATLHARHPIKVAIVGPKGETRELERTAHGVFRVGKSVLVFDLEQVTEDSLPELPEGLALTVPHLKGKVPCAVVCGNTTCQPPAHTPAELAEALRAVAR